MKRAFFITVFLWGFTSAYSQQHATCNDAIPVTGSSYGPVKAEGWADSSLCMPSNEAMYFGKTHKVVWFSFIIPNDTILTFDIIPVHPSDDFDFMLFKAERGDFCQKEAQRKVKPVRTNFAKPAKGSSGKTGLSLSAAQAMVAPGYNSPYSSALKVKKGEWYYLAVDNYTSTKGGFILKVHVNFNAQTSNNKSSIDAMPVRASRIAPLSNPNFFIHVLDSANHSLKATLILQGEQQGKLIEADTANYSLRLMPYKTLTIRANAIGYMPYQSTYSATGDTSSVTFWVRMQPIKAAQKITLKDINFNEDSPIMLPSSKPALDYLLQFLLNNPGVKIIIKGYVNDPNHTWPPNYDQGLSEKRANSVRNYLSSHGVDKNRIQCVGYGSARMLYPYPENADQEAANRRVEIEIQ